QMSFRALSGAKANALLPSVTSWTVAGVASANSEIELSELPTQTVLVDGSTAMTPGLLPTSTGLPTTAPADSVNANAALPEEFRIQIVLVPWSIARPDAEVSPLAKKTVGAAAGVASLIVKTSPSRSRM